MNALQSAQLYFEMVVVAVRRRIGRFFKCFLFQTFSQFSFSLFAVRQSNATKFRIEVEDLLPQVGTERLRPRSGENQVNGQ